MRSGRLWREAVRCVVLAGLSSANIAAPAVEVRFQPVAAGIYAHIGDTGGRTYENEGLNANVGFVVTPAGVVLIDSGATYRSARQIHEAIRRVTDRPVKWVINTGGQDHRWLGNGYFKEQGAEIIAHASARADMHARGGDQLQGLKAALKERADGTVPTLPTRLVEGNDVRLELGGVTLELKHRGGAHTPGDMMVWLPDRGVLFSGDVVYVDRLLGVIPVSNTRRWLQTFAVIEMLEPKIVVPGHGDVTDLATAQRDTKAYLLALRAHMKKAVDEGTDISAAIRSFDARPFMRLLNAAELHPGNASRTYLELERE
jgi:glyoxylase-like metal-dependent hydrolase (beta-lactamase superfamily II)